MKKILTLALFLSFSNLAPQAHAQGVACATYFGHKYFEKLKVMPRTDKFKHCTLSCIMAKNCGPGVSMLFGIGKEGWDAIGHGDPDWKDIQADWVGVKLGIRLPFHRDRECLIACSKPFPEPCHGKECE